MRYISEDGKVFNSEEECLRHEKVLSEEKTKREKLVEEKNKRKDEVIAAYDNFTELLKKFTDDYDEPVYLNNLTYPLERLLPRGIWRL